MESLVFLIALGVAVAVMAWFIANEVSGTAGEIGLLAIGPDAEAAARTDQTGPAARYRIRERPTPGRRQSIADAPPRRAYRIKPEDKPCNYEETNGSASVAEDF